MELPRWHSDKRIHLPTQKTGDMGSFPGLGRSPGGENGNSLQYSCQDNPMDRGAWRATIHRVTRSQTRLKWLSMHAWVFGKRTAEVSRHFHHITSWVRDLSLLILTFVKFLFCKVIPPPIPQTTLWKVVTMCSPHLMSWWGALVILHFEHDAPA